MFWVVFFFFRILLELTKNIVLRRLKLYNFYFMGPVPSTSNASCRCFLGGGGGGGGVVCLFVLFCFFFLFFFFFWGGGGGLGVLIHSRETSQIVEYKETILKNNHKD